MTISFEAFKKRFGQETKLRLTNGVTYSAWSVSPWLYRTIVPNSPEGHITHYKDAAGVQISVKKTGNQVTLFINERGERLALISLEG